MNDRIEITTTDRGLRAVDLERHEHILTLIFGFPPDSELIRATLKTILNIMEAGMDADGTESGNPLDVN